MRGVSSDSRWQGRSVAERRSTDDIKMAARAGLGILSDALFFPQGRATDSPPRPDQLNGRDVAEPRLHPASRAFRYAICRRTTMRTEVAIRTHSRFRPAILSVVSTTSHREAMILAPCSTIRLRSSAAHVGPRPPRLVCRCARRFDISGTRVRKRRIDDWSFARHTDQASKIVVREIPSRRQCCPGRTSICRIPNAPTAPRRQPGSSSVFMTTPPAGNEKRSPSRRRPLPRHHWPTAPKRT